MNNRFRVALLVVAVLIAYGNTLRNDFTLDDEHFILRNPVVTGLSIKALFEPDKDFNLFRPVTFATFAMNWAAGRMRPLGYHLLNVLFHLAVTLLLYLLLSLLFEPEHQAATVAWVTAFLFAVHPIHTEAVASIVGRSELLAAGFLLAAWYLHLRDRTILSLVCFPLALLSKESAIAFLPLVLAGDFARGEWKPLRRYAFIAGLSLAYTVLLWKVQGGRFGQKQIDFLDNPLASLPASWRILNALRIAWKYVALQGYPAALSCDYSYNAILLYANWRHNAPAAAAAALLVALWIHALWRRRRGWLLAGAIYLFGFAVTANLLIPTGTILGERLAYLPSAGFCLLAALLWFRLSKVKPALAWALFALLVSAMTTRTILRNRDWRDNFHLFSADVGAVPGSAKIHSNFGAELLHRGQLEEARTELQTALRIYPDSPLTLEWLGLLESRGNHDLEARRLLEQALSITPKGSSDYDFICVNLAAQLIKVGQYDDALKLLNQEIAESPAYARAWSNRAVIRYQRGELESARADAQTAFRLDPTNTQAQTLLNLLSAPISGAPRH